VATLIPSIEAPARAGAQFETLFGGARWWKPDLDAAAAAIRAAVRGEDATVASARDHILGHWTWRHATDRLIEILTEVEEG
jgi:hypothetical protein